MEESSKLTTNWNVSSQGCDEQTGNNYPKVKREEYSMHKMEETSKKKII